MSNNEHRHLKLEETMTIHLSESVRIWNIPTLHIKVNNLPETATIHNTFVMMASNGTWQAGLEWTVEGQTGKYVGFVLKCSSLQELLDKMPEVFEVVTSIPNKQ